MSEVVAQCNNGVRVNEILPCVRQAHSACRPMIAYSGDRVEAQTSKSEDDVKCF